MTGAKLVRIRFDKVVGFIEIYDGTRYLELFTSNKFDIIFNRIRYLIGVKKGITYIFSHNYAKIKADSHYSLPVEKNLTLHIVIILIKLVWKKDQNHHYYNKLLEKKICNFV